VSSNVVELVLTCVLAIVIGESAKARRIAAAEEAERKHQQYLAEQAEIAAAAKRAEQAKEQEALNQAKKEYMARTTTSAANAALLVEGNSIKDRLRKLKENEKERAENYKKTLEEWLEKNKVRSVVFLYACLSDWLEPMLLSLCSLRRRCMISPRG
jgi:hypothetical protein